jgi:hypothetical protein
MRGRFGTEDFALFVSILAVIVFIGLLIVGVAQETMVQMNVEAEQSRQTKPPIWLKKVSCPACGQAWPHMNRIVKAEHMFEVFKLLGVPRKEMVACQRCGNVFLLTEQEEASE